MFHTIFLFCEVVFARNMLHNSQIYTRFLFINKCKIVKFQSVSDFPSRFKNRPKPVFTDLSWSVQPLSQKVADEVVFRRFQREGVEFFFKSGLTDPPQIFDAYLLDNTNKSPSSFNLSVSFYIKIRS